MLFLVFVCFVWTLGPKPSLFLSFFVLHYKENNVFPPKKGISGLRSQCLPLLLPMFFFWAGGSPFSLSLSLYLFLVSFFIPCFLSLFLSSLFFCSLSCLVAFVSWKEQAQLLSLKGFFHQFFPLYGFLSCFVFQIPFSHHCFLILSCFGSTSKLLPFKKTTYKHQLLVKLGGCNKHFI